MTKTTIIEAVSAKIAGAGEKVANTIVDKMAEIEISRRVLMIEAGLKQLDALEKEYKKINKADNVTFSYTDTGEKVKHESYTSKRVEDIDKALQKIKNLESSINNALETNTPESYTKLDETIKKSNVN